jgi:small-conductance mechanosensitive channel
MIRVLTLVILAQAPGAAPAIPDTAVVRLGNRVVAVMRAPLGAAGPAERAAAATRRLEAAAAGDADSVATHAEAVGAVFTIGGRPVFTLTPGDVDTLAGATLESTTAATAGRLRLALAEFREAGDLRSVVLGAVAALAASLGLVVALVLVWRGRRRFGERVEVVASRIAPRVSIAGLSLLGPRQATAVVHWAMLLAAWALTLLVANVYMTFVLGRFAWTRPWAEALGGFLARTLAQLGRGMLGGIPELVTVALIFLVARFGARIVQRVFHAAETGAIVLPGVHPETAGPTRRIATALVWLFALAVAYPYLPGSESAAFRGVSVFAGLLITLGSAGLVGQAMSGLVLMYSRSFRPGDYVRVGDTEGTVLELNMLSTRVRTNKNEIVTLPNNVVVGGRIVDYTAIGRENAHLVIYTSVTIGYDVPWRQVHELLIAAAKNSEGIADTPEPYVHQRGLQDWYVEYQINAPVDPRRANELPGLHSRLHQNIQDAFWAAGVEIMSPSYFAVRDGNTATIPREQRPAGRAPAFRVDVNPD